jgi:transposase
VSINLTISGMTGREFAAWLGLVPRQNSTGGKARLGEISKRGDSFLRRLLVNGAHTVLLCSKAVKTDPWLTSLLSRKPRLVGAVAMADKKARIAWGHHEPTGHLLTHVVWHRQGGERRFVMDHAS